MASSTTLTSLTATGTLSHYHPPQTAPYKTRTIPSPAAWTSTAPFLTAHKTTLSAHTASSAPSHHATPEAFIALATQGVLLAAGTSNGTLYLFCRGHLLWERSAHAGEITSMGFCDDGETILSCGNDGNMHAHRISGAECVATLSHPLPVTCVAIGYGGASARVVTGCADGAARIWHLASERCICSVRLGAPVVAVCMRAEDVAWAGCSDGAIAKVRLNDVPVGGVMVGEVIGRREAGVSALAVLDEDVIAGYEDGVMCVYRGGVVISSFGRGAAVVGLVAHEDDEKVTDARDVIGDGIGRQVATGDEIQVVLRGRFGDGDTVGDGRNDVENDWSGLVREACSGVQWEDAETEADAEMDGGEGDDQKLNGLREEMEQLRERNRELEDAAKKLIDVVERLQA